MARFYKRKYRITFTPAANPEKEFTVHNINDDGTVKQVYLRVAFRLPIIYGDLSGSADLEIYNLNKDHRNGLRVDAFTGDKESAISKGDNVVDVSIEAGYEDDALFSQIWQGTIIFGRSIYEAPNWVTRLQLTPNVNVQRTRTSITQPKGGGSFLSPSSSMMNQCVELIKGQGAEASSDVSSLINTFGVLLDDKNSASKGASLEKGTFRNGNALTVLNDLLFPIDCKAWIDPSSNTLKMNQTGILTSEPLPLNENNGLISVPEESRNTVKFDSLLNPSFKPGAGVFLTSKTVTELVHVNSAEINCDTDARGPWMIKMEGAKINA